MKYLSGIDNLFLNQETPTQHMHVGGLGIYDPTSAPGGAVRFKDVLAFFDQRMSAAPVYRRRLVRESLLIDRPFWVSDKEVDVEYHVRHMALPEPGDWRQLMIQIARIHSRPLDLSRPPWEAYIIGSLNNVPGVPKGSFALYLKFHHSALDGEAAASLIGSLHTLSPDSMEAPKQRVVVADREPNSLELLSNSAINRAKRMRSLADLGFSVTRHALKSTTDSLPKLFSDREAYLQELLSKFRSSEDSRPKTRFNAPISAHRSLDACGLALDDCAVIRANVPGVTINDIFLTVAGGALKTYLTACGETPETSLMGTMPMTIRGADKGGDEGNQIAQTYYSLRTDIDDPVDRLRAVHEETSNLKDKLDTGLGRDFQARLLEVLPASIIAKPLTDALAENANVNVSNVRGPNQTLYLAGARLERFIPFSLVTEGCGLNLTGFSYNGILWVAVTACRELLPDPALFCEHLENNFAALKAAATAGSSAVAKPKKTAAKNSSSRKTVKNTAAARKTAKAKKSTAVKKKTGSSKRRRSVRPKITS